MKRAALFLLLLWLVQMSHISAASRLDFAYLRFGEDRLIGVAIYNPSDQATQLTFTAYGESGQLVAGPGLQNPVVFPVEGKHQFAAVTTSIFGAGGAAEEIAWFQVTSPLDGLTGFFIFLTTDFQQLDGTDLPTSSPNLGLTEVATGPAVSTEVTVVNPNAGTVTATATLFGAGQPLYSRLMLPGHGVLSFDVAERFGLETAVESGFLTIMANGELAAFAFLRSGDLLGLNAKPLDELLDTLYFPQMAVLGPFTTELVLVNNGGQVAIVTITAHREDGQPFGPVDIQQNPVATVLQAGEVRRFNLAELFGFQGNSLKEGWLEVRSTISSLAGSLSYALSSGARAAVASVSQGTRHAIFSHLATTPEFFTGLAGLNTGSLTANLRIVAIRADGSVLGTLTRTLQPGARFADLIGSEIIAAANGQAGGAVIVESDVSVFLTAIFGSLQTGALANIPPQELAADFTILSPALHIQPSLAVLTPSASQQFSLIGEGPAESWSVNGVAGGNAVLGTISAAGFYTAPALLPADLPLSIGARVGSSSVGASIDVITTNNLVANRGVIQSVAYLQGLDRLFTAELSAVFEPGRGAVSPSGAGSNDSTVFDVSSEPALQIRNFPSENIPKIIEFRAGNGQDFLLAAARGGGQVLRLDPLTSNVQIVAAGLDSPQAIVLDPWTGDLLVAEANQVSVVPAIELNQGLVANVSSADGAAGRRVRKIGVGLNPAGIAVDSCSGDVYVSDPVLGAVVRINRVTSAWQTVVDGLVDPGQMLAVYREGVSCPDSFQLLVVERGRDQVSLVIPDQGVTQKWIDAPGVADVALLPPENSTGLEQGILIARLPAKESGSISAVETMVYEGNTLNPPMPFYPGESGTRKFTSSQEFFQTLNGSAGSAGLQGSEIWWVEGFESFPSGAMIPHGSTANGITYFFPEGRPGLVGSEYNHFETQGLQLYRAPGQHYFFGGESVTVQFDQPCFAAGVFINANLDVNSTSDIFLQTPVGTVTSGGLVYDDPFFPVGFPTFFFVGIISDLPFSTATFGSAGLLVYTVDNLVCAPAP